METTAYETKISSQQGEESFQPESDAFPALNDGHTKVVKAPTKAKGKSPKKEKKKKKPGYRKAPQAPRRFKSPYILFSISKMAEYKSAADNVQVTSVSRRIAEEWKALPDEERKKWDQIALQDKLRYNAEKRLYTGPWHVPSKRSRKVCYERGV